MTDECDDCRAKRVCHYVITGKKTQLLDSIKDTLKDTPFIFTFTCNSIIRTEHKLKDESAPKNPPRKTKVRATAVTKPGPFTSSQLMLDTCKKIKASGQSINTTNLQLQIYGTIYRYPSNEYRRASKIINDLYKKGWLIKLEKGSYDIPAPYDYESELKLNKNLYQEILGAPFYKDLINKKSRHPKWSLFVQLADYVKGNGSHSLWHLKKKALDLGFGVIDDEGA